MEGQKERQGDFVFTAQTVGEYRFCFSNEMSTYADKMVDFEVAVGPDEPAMLITISDTSGSRSNTNPSRPFCLKKPGPALNSTLPSRTQSSK